MTTSLTYPPIDPAELRNCHAFENIARVVVTQHHVYGLTTDGQWIEFKPKAECGDHHAGLVTALGNPAEMGPLGGNEGDGGATQ